MGGCVMSDVDDGDGLLMKGVSTRAVLFTER